MSSNVNEHLRRAAGAGEAEAEWKERSRAEPTSVFTYASASASAIASGSEHRGLARAQGAGEGAGQGSDAAATRVISFGEKLLVGASAGVFGTTVVYPIDVIKTTMQSNNALGKVSLITATRNTARSIHAISGFAGFYRGFGACLVGVAPEKALKLAVNDMAREKLTAGQTGPIQMHQEIAAGILTGFMQLGVTVPYEGVKIQLQMQGAMEPAMRRSGMQVLKDMGPTGMYRGLTATFFRDVPFCMLFFPLYSNVKGFVMKHTVKDPNGKEPFHVGLIAGLVAGGLGGVMVTPCDMLKTRTQQGINRNMGLFAYAGEVVRKEGFSALYRGWHTRLAIIAPLYGIVSVAFELQKQWLSPR
ncbi:mitochondrial carrier domain-containing protein [Ochromonadaceae sp. CCMP2298]|nr:mitochondrial carrier domain-containing protein [Ochromonadaceae sp. CCMP2298]|mmetsp:Transcript_4404/g.9911  ORF Transcript_4404/g.9911 Transcript_4404/m.9911 type:complete len:359 (+) Transcript_4404:187-1263(+)